MQRYTVYFIWKLLYMFRVVPPPIIRSANNYIYSIWYLLHTVTAICRYRGRAGTGLSVLWVACYGQLTYRRTAISVVKRRTVSIVQYRRHRATTSGSPLWQPQTSHYPSHGVYRLMLSRLTRACLCRRTCRNAHAYSVRRSVLLKRNGKVQLLTGASLHIRCITVTSFCVV
jgi:hypothetical protein